MDNQEISIKFSNKVDGEKALQQYEQRLKSIYSCVVGIEKGQGVFNTTKASANELANTTNKTAKNIEKMAKQFNIGFNFKSMTAYFRTATAFFKQLASMTQKSVNYVENINLLEVAYHNANEEIEDSSARIEKFIDKMSEVYGLDESDLARKLGVFKQLANAMQLPTETAEHLSELMVKMTQDIASLYNLDLNRASNALQSALAGQVRPIRSATGADITEKTLQQTVDALGLKESISDLSYVEKRLVMVISLTNQLKNSQGDYARTITSASNQIRIMKEQFSRLARAVGNTLYPILEGIMPYVNGILMALTEIFQLIASLLGFKMPDFDYGDLVGVGDAVMDLEEDLDGAGESADKLNNKLKGLRGFDKLNVINTPSSSGGASGGGAGGGIDPTIMDAFNKAFSEYNDKLDTVKLKAHDIRDAIMDWLGFTKLVNEETGKITWIYNGSNEVIDSIVQTVKNAIPHLEKIWEYSKKIFTGVAKEFFEDLASGPYGKIMETMLKVVRKVFEIIANNEFLIKMIAKLLEVKLLTGFITNLGKVKSLLGGSNGIFGILSKIYGSTVDLFKTMKDFPNKPLTDGIEYWRIQKGIIDENTGKVAGFKGAMNGVKTALEGAVGALTGFVIYDTALKDMNENGMNLANTMGALAGGLTTVASLMTTGASIGGTWGAVIGGVTGAVLTLGDAFLSFESPYEKGMKKAQEFIDKQNEVIDSIKKVGITQIEELEKNKVLIENLDDVVDANGRVKEGYEDRANLILTKINDAYGTEYELIDGIIAKRDGEKQSIDDVKNEVDKLIEAKKKEILLNVFQSTIEETMKNQIDLAKKKKEKQEELNKLYDVQNELVDKYGYKGILANSGILDKTNKINIAYQYMQGEIKKVEGELDGLNKQEKENKKQIEDNEEAMEELTKATGDGIDEIIDKYLYGTEKTTKETEKNTKKTKGWFDDILTKVNEISKPRKTTIDVDGNFDAFNQKANSSMWDLINNAKNIKVGKANGGIFANGQWHDVTAYGTGGLPPVGQMFVARERGPELVGTIGGHTAVMNNDQIVGSVSNGVYQAVRSAMGNQNQGAQVFNIYLDEEHKIGTYTLDQLQNMAKSNGKAITLG